MASHCPRSSTRRHSGFSGASRHTQSLHSPLLPPSPLLSPPPSSPLPRPAPATPADMQLQRVHHHGGVTTRRSAACQAFKAGQRMHARAPPSAPEQPAPSPLLAAAVSSLSALVLLGGGAPALAEFKLPPISSDPTRCERGYVGNTIGQANAVSDTVLDLRKCSFAGKNLSGKTLAGALLAEADLSNANLQEAVLTKSYAVDANFAGADLTNAVVDRVDFSKANLKGTKLVNAVVTGAVFEGADLTDSVWEEALIGNEDVKRLCSNPTLQGESRQQVGCRVK